MGGGAGHRAARGLGRRSSLSLTIRVLFKRRALIFVFYCARTVSEPLSAASASRIALGDLYSAHTV
jgi:hypothetical protein